MKLYGFGWDNEPRGSVFFGATCVPETRIDIDEVELACGRPNALDVMIAAETLIDLRREIEHDNKHGGRLARCRSILDRWRLLR